MALCQPTPPITQLPSEWELWEAVLEAAINDGLQLGNKPGITEEEKQSSERWRSRVREVPKYIHRAHLVLVWILHFYVHTLAPQPDSELVRIPPLLSIPLLQISKATDQPPVLTYVDEVILNSYLGASDNEPNPVSRLETLTTHIHTLHETPLSIKRSCNPDFFYNFVRPWLGGGIWVFEGEEMHTHACEIKCSPKLSHTNARRVSWYFILPESDHQVKRFSQRHANVRVLFTSRVFGTFAGWRMGRSESAGEAYEKGVDALKQFRDVYIVIVTLLVVGPAKRAKKAREKEMKGTAGTDLVFLKDVRDIRRSSRAGSCE
ncbi:hypothetical protein WG66_006316 [Moniliophthora roreri]|nr:hypothetical protein WG66_006316 [Moniliophthora roreri]